MSKPNRTTTWDVADAYPENLRNLVSSLIVLSDKDYQRRVWVKGEGSEHDFYYNRELLFDEDIDYFKKRIRKEELNLSPEQIKAVLRVHAMMDHFGGIEWSFKLPNNPYYHLYIINHPYWQKIREQASHALELLKPLKDQDQSAACSC
jgi:metal-dependent hydrolase (beta-lactamase superfamily II)